MRSTSSSKKFSVFDFNEEEECIERTSRKMLSKYKDPNKCGSDDTAVTKYSFLQCFAQGTKTQRKDLRNEPLDVDAIDDAVEERISGLDTAAPSGSSNYKPNGLIGINSDDEDSTELRSSSTSASVLVGSEGPQEEQIQGHGFGGYDIETLVVVSPDSVIYGTMFCLKPRLTFSCSCIKLDGSTVFANKGPFNLEWTVADILNIESRYAEQVETAVVNLHLKSKDTKVAENANSSGIVELSFTVFDPYWSKREEAIKSLDVRYKDRWNVAFNIDAVRNGDVFLGQNSVFFSKHNFFNLDESFEDVIYPKGDPDAVSISKRDIQLLQPETFINDTIIDFYIQYLKNKVKPEERHRFHFFNSFFFRKLADLDKDPSRACEGRAAFQRVCKWTRKVNLFEKDYIFIPVNFSLHWSLIVICHPGEVVNLEDEEMENLPKVPCILHLDSIKGSHRGLRNIFQSYLLEEWKQRHNESVEDISSKFLNLQFVPLELPQQENSFDCGLFLLHYVELFLEHAPGHFSPFRISKFSNFLGKDWFPPAEASLKRAHIKELIYKIVEDSSQKVPPSVSNNKYSSEFVDIIGEDSGVEFLHKICNSKQSCHGSFSDSNADQDIDITPRAAVHLRDVQCFGKSKLIFDGLLDPGDNARSRTDGNCDTLGQIVLPNRFKNFMSPIEEGEEMGEQTTCSPTDEAYGQLVVKITEPFRATETSTVPRISVDCEEDEKADKSSGTSIGGSPISSEVRKNEKSSPDEFLDLSPEEDREDTYECSSTSSDGLSACVVEDSEEESIPTFVVEDSEEENGGQDIIEFDNYHRHGRIVASSTQEADSVANTDCMANHIPPLLKLEEWQGAKRPRLMPLDAGRRLKKKLAKDLILI